MIAKAVITNNVYASCPKHRSFQLTINSETMLNNKNNTEEIILNLILSFESIDLYGFSIGDIYVMINIHTNSEPMSHDFGIKSICERIETIKNDVIEHTLHARYEFA